jgi:hypothetical protein
VTFARRMSGTIGAKMKSTAPLAYASATWASLRSCDVTKMIGVCRESSRRRIMRAVS